MADEVRDLLQQISSISKSTGEQVAGELISLDSTLVWYEDIINRAIENLDLVVKSYIAQIGLYEGHLVLKGEALVTLTAALISDVDNDTPGSIAGEEADIMFDAQQIELLYKALEAQIFQHEKVIEWTIDRIIQAEAATEQVIEGIGKSSEKTIESKEAQIKQKEAFDGVCP